MKSLSLCLFILIISLVARPVLVDGFQVDTDEIDQLENKIAIAQEIADRGIQDQLPPEKRERFDNLVKRGLVTLPGQEQTSTVAEENTLLTIKCNAPKGIRFDFGPDPLYKLKKHQMLQSEEAFSGMNPQFIIDPSNPKEIIITSGSSMILGIDDSKAVRIPVLIYNEHLIVAYEKFKKGIWVYSLFPKNGIGFLSTHRLYRSGSAINSSFNMKCDFIF